MSTGTVVYCLDTSALVDAYTRCYPPQAFPGLWQEVEKLIGAQRFYAPVEVWDELKDRGDDLTAWAKARPQIFVASTYVQHGFLGLLAQRYPELRQNLLTAPWADPFVVALAQTRQYTVVSQEKGRADKIPKIPQMCQEYQVAHLPFVGMILAEGWVFA